MSGVRGRSGRRPLTCAELKLRGSFCPIKHAARARAEAKAAAEHAALLESIAITEERSKRYQRECEERMFADYARRKQEAAAKLASESSESGTEPPRVSTEIPATSGATAAQSEQDG